MNERPPPSFDTPTPTPHTVRVIRDVELLSIDYLTLFQLTASGRIERENDPDHSPGPRLWLAGCAAGNVAGVRADVGYPVAAEVMELIATEPPLVAHDAGPRHLERYVELLSIEGVVPEQQPGVIYELPHCLQPALAEHDPGMRLVDSESAGGERLHASFREHGLPAGLTDLGFEDVSALWPPWCALLREGEVASVAFAARLCETGAELGLATARAHRGRGYAAAATAGWSRMPSLRSRALFYSTARANVSSQRVAARLGLRRIGASLRL